MIDYADFIRALKSSWVRRLIHSKEKWKNILQVQLDFNMEFVGHTVQISLKRLVRTFQILSIKKCFRAGQPSIK